MLHKHKKNGTLNADDGDDAKNERGSTTRKSTLNGRAGKGRSGSSEGSDRPSHWSNDQGTAFHNPWPSAQVPTLSEMLSGGLVVGWAKPHHKLQSDSRAREIQVVKPDWGEGRGATARSARGDRFVRDANDHHGKLMLGTWLGHAGAYVEMPWGKAKVDQAGASLIKSPVKTFKMLFDPIFSGRAGPTAYTGPARYRPSPCEVDDLPGCDALFISHNHYDHLDLSSIQSILNKFPECRYYVPLGNKAWFVQTGAKEENVFELDWWQDVELFPADVGHENDQFDDLESSNMRITCVPAQHNSGRTGIDSGSTLWCGWVVEHFVKTKESKAEDSSTKRLTRRGSLYFAGDTGYRRHRNSKAICPIFKELGEKFGPMDLSFVPIWRGGSLGFVSWLGLRLNHENIPSGLHGSPTDAVSIHLDTRSRNTIGVHFGTFIGAENESLEAIIELNAACDEAGILRLEDDDDEVARGGVKKESNHRVDFHDKGRMGVVDLGETIVIEIEDLVIVD